MSKETVSSQIFVGNVAWATTEEKLGAFFKTYGEVTLVKLLMSVTINMNLLI
jgi:RNA recognition motif-containing protein